jgi:hypothetical protein
VVELLDDEEGDEGSEGAVGDQGRQAQGTAGNVGSATQAVANILTIDLPDDCEPPSRTPGGLGASSGAGEDEEMDELDTPLSLRFARSSADRAAARIGGAGSSGGQREWDAAGAVGPAVDKRSRLAMASGPAAAAAEEQAHADAASEPAGEGCGMEIDDSPGEQQDGGWMDALHAVDPSDGRHIAETPPAEEAQESEHEAKQEGTDAAAPSAVPAAGQQTASDAGRAAAARGVAARFSVRQLERHPERPVVVHKGTPLPGVLPPSAAKIRSVVEVGPTPACVCDV